MPRFPHCPLTFSSAVLLTASLTLLPLPARSSADDDPAKSDPPATSSAKNQDAKPELFTGRVVFLAEALKRKGIRAAEKETAGQVVLEADDGELIPLLPDWRGRAFFQDERLRNRRVELVGNRPRGVPYLHVLSVYTFDEKGTRQYTDYWCEVCRIAMYEIKPCDCCQDEIELRFQPRDLPDYVTRKPSPEASR